MDMEEQSACGFASAEVGPFYCRATATSISTSASGTAEQYVRWFRKGFQTGNLADGETFTVPDDQL